MVLEGAGSGGAGGGGTDLQLLLHLDHLEVVVGDHELVLALVVQGLQLRGEMLALALGAIGALLLLLGARALRILLGKSTRDSCTSDDGRWSIPWIG